MIKLKQTITACLLSAILVSAIALPAFAVDESVDQTPVVVDEQVEKNSDTGGTQDSEVPVDTPADEPVDTPADEPTDEPTDKSVDESSQTSEKSEISVVSDTPTDESEDTSSTPESKQESQEEDSKEESEVSEESSKQEINTGEQLIYFYIDLGGEYGKCSWSKDLGYLTFANVKCTVYKSDGKTQIASFKLEDRLFDSTVDNRYTISRSVKVPEWKKGTYYILRFENLPSIYPSSTQEIKLVYKSDEVGMPLGTSEEDSMLLKLIPNNFNSLFYVYDKNGTPIYNAKVDVKGYDDDGNLVYSKSTTSKKDGVASLFINNSDVGILKISVPSILNKSVVTGTVQGFFNFAANTSEYPSVTVLKADANYDGKIRTADGTVVQEGCSVPFTVEYKSANDMLLFKHTTVNVSLYDRTSAFNSIVLSPENKTEEFSLAEGSKYTVKALNIPDYSLSVSPTTLTVSKSAKVTVTATPQMSLKVINERNGVKNNAHFEILGYGKQFNEQAHVFSVNYDQGLSIKNLDNGEVFELFIGAYKETVLNIADWTVQQNGFIKIDYSEDTPNTSSSAGYTDSNVITTVPKTGDTILGVGLALCGLTILSFTGYQYYKRKGKKYNESKK